MPGSRSYEVENLIPFYFTAALRVLRERPEVPVAFGLSPFTSLEQVRVAIERGGDPRVFAQRGRLVIESGRTYLESLDGEAAFRCCLTHWRPPSGPDLVLTIPGTKTIELATFAKPAITITPLNAPELVTSTDH